MFEKLAAKLNEPKLHRGIALLLTMGSMLAPSEYQPYILGVAGILGVLGYSLPDGTQKKVEALLVAHGEMVNVVAPLANQAGVDTSALNKPMPSSVPGKPSASGPTP